MTKVLFLIRYNRALGRIESFQTFPESDREKVEDERLALELELNRKGIFREVVLLEATSEAALRLTHRRYFEDVSTLSESPDGGGNAL